VVWLANVAAGAPWVPPVSDPCTLSRVELVAQHESAACDRDGAADELLQWRGSRRGPGRLGGVPLARRPRRAHAADRLWPDDGPFGEP
jgi:hypothetical protein